MESHKRRGRGTTPSRVGARSAVATPPLLPNIDALLDEGGQITWGALHPIKCAAIANDDHNCLAMLQRRSGETFQQLLERLDTAIGLAWTDDKFTDEINPTPPPSKLR